MTSKKQVGKSPEVIYASSINLNGLYSVKPIKLKKSILDDEDDAWWDEDGNFHVETLGLEVTNSFITFSSEKEEDVKIWIKGARSTLTLIKNWAHSSFSFRDVLK